MSCSADKLKQGWYLLKTKNREEVRAQENLEALGFEAYCPLIFGKAVQVPLFPSYIFIRLGIEGEPPYHKIRSTRGILHIVRFNRMNHKLNESGRLPKNQTASLLPSPIPNGDQIIDQIEAITWLQNGADPEEKPSNLRFQSGETVLYDNPLFRHLETTFIKGVNIDRGIVLIKFIESMRTDDGGEERKVIAERELNVPLKDLHKVAEEA
ncbi:transcription termination/antitermination NusG family protein [uncultured Endozoicomonas sp.]|uniref:transcription termination/antitermination NusG family protein n=1 Tax=uncultured Endozoicomonas sp. TaxID=432652 RepID=UPI0026202484|nr:transcription termination/antitermination NusG family protein [uncultured Endozoicomonas sp.]